MENDELTGTPVCPLNGLVRMTVGGVTSVTALVVKVPMNATAMGIPARVRKPFAVTVYVVDTARFVDGWKVS
jgi:hypothetical protein